MKKSELLFSCMNPKLVPIEKVVVNEHVPDEIDSLESDALIANIEKHGLLMAIVVCYDNAVDQYTIVDGVHRYKLLRYYFKCDKIPVIVIKDDIT